MMDRGFSGWLLFAFTARGEDFAFAGGGFFCGAFVARRGSFPDFGRFGAWGRSGLWRERQLGGGRFLFGGA